MDYANSWKPDPFGIHELRFFSADGRPTPLVMDAGNRSFDRPPATGPASAAEPPVAQTPVAEPPVVQPPVAEAIVADPHVAEPPVAPAPVADPPVAESPVLADSLSASPSGSAETSTLTDSMYPTSVGTPGSATSHNDPGAQSPAFGSPSAVIEPVVPPQPQGPSAYAGPFIGGEFEIPQTAPEGQQTEPLSRPLKIAYAVVLSLLALSVVGVVLVHVAHQSDAKVTQAASVTTTTTTAATTTTTAVLPAALSSSAQAAATALVSSWSVNDRTVALTVATPAAVNTLFGAPYTSGQAIARGCSTSFSPIVCTYGPPGGASPSDPIYQIMVSQTNGGWYVSSVKKEN
jgi:hypothetical protein